MLVIIADIAQQWDYRMYLWIGSMLLVVVVLFLAAVAVFVGSERERRTDD